MGAPRHRWGSLLYEHLYPQDGCGRHSDPTCLCDVRLEGVASTSPIYTGHMRGVTPDAESILGWMEKTAKGMDALGGLSKTTDEILASAEAAADALDVEPCERQQGRLAQDEARAHMIDALRGGITTLALARLIGRSQTFVLSVLARGKADPMQLAEAERLIRGQQHTSGQIAAMTGLSAAGVRSVASWLGLQIPQSPLNQCGWSDDVRAQALDLVASGLTPAAVHRRLSESLGERAPSRQVIANWTRRAREVAA